MSRIAFLYPGQGAQEVGMAGDFYEKSEEAKAVFDQASSILDFDVREICFQKNDLLDKTEYTQSAMVTACLATISYTHLGSGSESCSGSRI